MDLICVIFRILYNQKLYDYMLEFDVLLLFASAYTNCSRGKKLLHVFWNPLYILECV